MLKMSMVSVVMFFLFSHRFVSNDAYSWDVYDFNTSALGLIMAGWIYLMYPYKASDYKVFLGFVAGVALSKFINASYYMSLEEYVYNGWVELLFGIIGLCIPAMHVRFESALIKKAISKSQLSETGTYFVLYRPNRPFSLGVTALGAPISSNSVVHNGGWYRFNRKVNELQVYDLAGLKAIFESVLVLKYNGTVNGACLEKAVGTKYHMWGSNCVSVYRGAGSCKPFPDIKFNFFSSVPSWWAFQVLRMV